MLSMVSYFLSTDAAATAIYSLFLHDALPISLGGGSQGGVYEAYVARDTVDPSIGRRPELVGQGQWDLLARIVRERSEEHTSELQSQSNLVCRLLLEKKHCSQCRRSCRLPSRR